MPTELVCLTNEQKSIIHLISKQLALAEIPYKYGAKPDYSFSIDEIAKKRFGVDCSWLTKYIYYKLGILIKDGSIFQFNDSAEISIGNEQVGDLVFKKNKQGIVCHVGMIMGCSPTLTVEASGTFKKVVIRDIERFKVFPSYIFYAGVKRLLKSNVKIISV